MNFDKKIIQTLPNIYINIYIYIFIYIYIHTYVCVCVRSSDDEEDVSSY